MRLLLRASAWLPLLLALLLMVRLSWLPGEGSPANVPEQRCNNADTQPCEDLLSAELRIIRHHRPEAIHAACGNPQSDGCAIRHVRFEVARCDIHLLANAPPQVLEHERNHCRGWDHQGDSAAAYAAPWHVNAKAWRARGAYLSGR